VALGFLCVRILPAYRRIFQDFRRQVPFSMLSITKAAEAIAFSPLTMLLLLMALVAFVYVVGRYCGLIQWDAPIVRRYTIKLDQALVMRALAQCVAQQQQVPKMLDALAEQYPKAYIRRRLGWAARRTANGANWCDALVRAGLLPAADASVLRSAERVGN